MRTLIIDDEKQARNALRELIQLSLLPITVAGEADGVQTGIAQILSLQPELVLLDIEMADGNGFDLLEKCPWRDFHVIFVTAYDQFALQAFRFSATDYLLKPVGEKELAEALGKILRQRLPKVQQESIQVLLQNQQPSTVKRIGIPGSEGISFFQPAEIIRCQSDGGYTRIYCTGGQKMLSGKSLKEYEELLTPFGFERVHHSHLVNLSHIRKYLNRDGGFLVMEGGEEVPLSQRKKTHILSILSKDSG